MGCAAGALATTAVSTAGTMKIKTISRDVQHHTRECRRDKTKVFRNADPKLHPMEKAREYQRALVATKMERMFAKPFLGALEGHSDSVNCCATSRHSLVAFVSGACDGELRVWDLAHRKCVTHTYGHARIVTGVTFSAEGQSFFSCGDDSYVKQWALHSAVLPDEADEEAKARHVGHDAEPLQTWQGRRPFNAMDHHWQDNQFATASATLDVWDHHRSEPVHSFEWGADSLITCKWNPAERGLIASSATDRNLVLYDVREASAIRKLIMAHKTNAIAWNPREPFNFSIASEDSQCYTFDMRKLSTALKVHKDHMSAVMDLAYSPTGKEFVTGSYDRTIRIFRASSGTSREVYHSKRMQRVFCVAYSADNRFVVSGSDDTNIRVWKARASEKIGKVSTRERAKNDYNKSLKRRYQHMSEVRRIDRHRKVPAVLRKAKRQRVEMEASERRKHLNRVRHSKPGTHKKKRESEKQIVREVP